ncbi:hypothetical protein [Pandoraea sp. ISTKB]|uniref:hypothetical protein n=1 Tax=Pandoraea sp. ISTKB TaxID=1586708 RepID=UPI00084793B3|nr:hypothetical protein [Pandoraea sp. ISTKB]ODP31649.1 hypothetical protein A9762_06610 [Pandoraea sp. ISTKB]
MNVDFAIELMRWFSTAEPTALDYQDPGIRLVLKKDAVPVARVETGQPQATSVAPDVPAFKAPATGRFLHKHPMDGIPLAVTGRKVALGEVIGYLQIGDALSAVEAPFAAEVADVRMRDGTVAEFGEVLMSVAASRSL